MVDSGFVLQPEVYATAGMPPDLSSALDQVWRAPQEATLYAASAFVDHNGVLPFVKLLKSHVDKGGDVKCFFAGSPSQNMASRQAVEELLTTGAEVHLLNRKKIFHSKMYGMAARDNERLVVSSGNFTGNGIALNVESTVVLEGNTLEGVGFSWSEWEEKVRARFDWVEADLDLIANVRDPAWRLTFDENRGRPESIAEEAGQADEILATTLSPTDTNRVKSLAYPGTAYFWLSKSTTGYFPRLSIRNRPGAKKTFTADIDVEFLDVGISETVNVTFEAYNNLDFRLRVSPLRGTGVARPDDIALLDRVSDRQYRMRIVKAGSPTARRITPYLIHFVGHKGKRWGMVPRSLVAKDVAPKAR